MGDVRDEVCGDEWCDVQGDGGCVDVLDDSVLGEADSEGAADERRSGEGSGEPRRAHGLLSTPLSFRSKNLPCRGELVAGAAAAAASKNAAVGGSNGIKPSGVSSSETATEEQIRRMRPIGIDPCSCRYRTKSGSMTR